MARRVAVWLVALVLIASGGVALWALRYQPLVHGDYFACGVLEIRVEGRACVVEYRRDRGTIWAFTLRNEGSVGVTVTGVALAGSEAGLLRTESVLMWPRNGLDVFRLKEGPLVPIGSFL